MLPLIINDHAVNFTSQSASSLRGLFAYPNRDIRSWEPNPESRMPIYKCNWSQSYFTMKWLTEQKIQLKGKNVKPFSVINKCKMETDKVIWKDASCHLPFFNIKTESGHLKQKQHEVTYVSMKNYQVKSGKRKRCIFLDNFYLFPICIWLPCWLLALCFPGGSDGGICL